MPPRYKKGERVEAKWPGSAIFNPAEVVEAGPKECRVLFEDGSTYTVKTSSLKAFTEKPRKRGRPRSRSSSRTDMQAPRSRSRSSSRSKSEKKKPSPMKTRKSTTSLLPDKPKNEVEAIARKTLEEEMAKPKRLSVTLNSIHIAQIEAATSKNILQPRTSARIAALQTKRSITRTPDPDDKKKKAESRNTKQVYSDEEDEDTEVPRQPHEFSYASLLAVVLKIILLPLTVLFCVACTKKQCTISNVQIPYLRWETLFRDIQYPLPSCAAFHFILFLFSKVPIGKEVKGFSLQEETPKLYRLNGFYALLTAIITFTSLVYFNYNTNWGFAKINGIVISSLIYTGIWSFVLHCYGLFGKKDPLKATKNPKSGFLGKFYYGHEKNPILFFNEDVKTRFIQFGLIGLILLDMSIFCKFVMTKGFAFTPLTLTLLMHFFFVFDFFWREETMLSTSTYVDDGVGYGFIMGIGSVIPSSFAMQSIFLFNYNAEKVRHLPQYCSIAILTLYIAGCYIHMTSMNLKHMYRKNPYNSALSHIKGVATSRKRRLISSGLWGRIRHPNYLGLLIMVISCCLPSGFTHVHPYIPLALITLLLLMRIFTVEAQCKEKYGPAWQNYVDIVPKRIIPYIF